MSSTCLEEAERVMVICNACRYCEGFCAVFPAMELRRTFADQDLKYLANLCHNCRACYYACQYAPPHEFNVNIPRALGELRIETYREFSWPPSTESLFSHNGRFVAMLTTLCIAVVMLPSFLFHGHAGFFDVHTGPGAFYRIISYSVMVLTFSALALMVLVSLGKGVTAMWLATGGTAVHGLDLRAHRKALLDVLQLRYLDGGGGGCNYPDERFSMVRRIYHQGVLYGFMLCLSATTVAASYDHLLHRPAPYPFWSWPVILGTVGGMSLLGGTSGLLYLKWRMDREPSVPSALGMDTAFSALLFLTSLSGLLLLVLRNTKAMGILLTVHLGIVLGLFVTLPYGKFVHAFYRYAALVRNASEQAAD